MKTITACRTTITGIFLALAGLILSCQNPTGETSRHHEPEPQVPDGQGRAVLELPVNVSPRTVIPGTIAIKNYRVILTPPADASWRPVEKTYDAGGTVREDIGPGKWSGNVYAYGLDSITPIAQADVDFEISAGEIKYIPVVLRWNSAEKLSGNGTVNVKLNFPGQITMADVTEVKLSISKLDDILVLNNLKLNEGDNKIALVSGVYIGRLAINDRWQRTGYFTEAIWIYPGETSVWEINATNEVQEGEYGCPILVISVDPLQPPTLLAPVMECERGVTVVYSLLGSAGQYKGIRWYTDGVLQTAANDKMSFNFSTRNRITGMNEILVIVTDSDGLTLSASTRLNILPGKNDDAYHIRNANELISALENIGTSSKTESIICVDADFAVSPIVLGAEFANKKIHLTSHDGEKTVTLEIPGSLFTVSSNVSLTVGEQVRLKGIGNKGNTSPLVSMNGGELVVKGILSGNETVLLKNRANPLAVGAIYAENSHVILDGGVIEHMIADHTYPYEVYFGGNITSVGGIYAKNSVIELKNGAVIKGAEGYIMDTPSYAAGALYLDAGSTAAVSNSSIKDCKAGSYNFTSIAASGVYVSEDSRLTLHENSLISGNWTNVWDLYNQAAGTILVRGSFEMLAGTVENNVLQYWHRYYNSSYTYGSAGIYVGSQAVFYKSGGIVHGTDSPLTNRCVSDNDIEIGTAIVAAAAYYATDNRCVNLSF